MKDKKLKPLDKMTDKRKRIISDYLKMGKVMNWSHTQLMSKLYEEQDWLKQYEELDDQFLSSLVINFAIDKYRYDTTN